MLIDWVTEVDYRRCVPVGGKPGVALSGLPLRDCMLDPGAKAHAALAMVETYGVDAAFFVGDIVIEAEAFGSAVIYDEKEMPSIVEPIVATPREAGALVAPEVMDGDSRTAVNVECVRLLVESVGEDIPVLAHVTGPLTVAGGLLGYEAVCRLVANDPPLVERVLETVLPFILSLARAQLEAGARILWVGEPVAALLSPRMFDRFCAPYLRELFSEAAGMNLLHVCGDTTPHISRLVETGAQGLSLDSAVDLSAVIEHVPEDVVLMGNIDPVSVMRDGSAEDVRATSRALLASMADRRNFILSTGCSTPLDTPAENIHALVETAHDHPAKGRDRS